MRGKSFPNNNGGKMTFMIIQLEGGDATLQEGFRTIRTALENIGAKGAKLLPTPLSAPASPAAPLEPQESNGEDEASISADVVAPKRPPKERSPQIINLELDKRNSLPPLKEFMGNHASLGVKQRYLLCAHWLKETLGIQEVSMDHMHTCFRHMDWGTPPKPAQPLRVMSTQEYGWFEKGVGKGLYKITHVGETKARAIVKGEDK